MDRIAPSSRLSFTSIPSATPSSSGITLHAATTTPDAFETRFGRKGSKGRKLSRLKSLGMTLAGLTAPVLLNACSGAHSQPSASSSSTSSSSPTSAASSSPAPSSSSSPTIDPCDNTAELQQAEDNAVPNFGDNTNDIEQALDAATQVSEAIEEQSDCQNRNNRTSP